MAMITFNRQQHFIWQTILLSLILTNWQYLHWPILGLIAGLCWLLFNAKKLGDIYFDFAPGSLKNIFGFLSILFTLSLIYSLFYHFWLINAWAFIGSLALVTIVTEFSSLKQNISHYFLANLDFSSLALRKLPKIIIPLAILWTDLLMIWYVNKKASTELIRSPWELLNFKFWVLLSIASILLIIWILQTQKSQKKLFLVSLHFLIISSLALWLYPLGFGYDQFLHQSALQVIKDTGTLKPHLFLYIGQYAWTLFLSDLWQVSLIKINQYLVPVSFALLWPYTLYYGLKYGLKWSTKITLSTILISIIFGFNFAIMTTPQNLAFILSTIFIFLLPLLQKNQNYLIFATLFSLGLLTIHPLGGISSFILVLFLWWEKTKFSPLTKKIGNLGLYLSAVVSLPLFFALYQYLAKKSWTNIFSWHVPKFNVPKLHWAQSYNFALDFAHNLGQNIDLIFMILFILSAYLIFKKHKYLFFTRHYLVLSYLALNYLVAWLFISFSEQIDYQQNDYLLRIILLFKLSSIPVLLTTWFFAWRTSLKKPLLHPNKIFLITISVIIILTSTYFSYPLYDRYKNSQSFNVTADDLETVSLIAESSGDENYIVLANQMLGAAAIDKYGFKHYYQNNFYYSMPVGDENIYQEFLSMIEIKADKETALKAMDKAQVARLYFVVPNYWHSAKSATTQAKESADSYFNVGNNTVFLYKR